MFRETEDDDNSLSVQADGYQSEDAAAETYPIHRDSPVIINTLVPKNPRVVPHAMTVDLVDEEDTEPQILVGTKPEAAMDTTTSSGQEEAEHRTIVQMDDDKDTIVWNDDFFIELSPLHSDIRHLSSTVRVWKDAEWTLLVIVNPSRRKAGVFLGIDDASKLPYGWKLRTRFRFALLDENDVEIDIGSVETYDFKSSISSGRDDFGSFTYFKYDALEKCIVEVDGSSFVQLKIQVVLEHIFLPPTIPSSHNSKASTNMVGLANLGATCYLNSLLQMLYHINRFRKAVYQLPHEHEEDPRSSTTLALQALFKNLQFSNSEVSTKDLTLSFGWTTNEAFMQQDVQEMMRILLDRLEDKMKGTTVDGMIKDLFCGKVRSYIRCIHVNYESKREEDFYDIQLDVKGCKTIYESFQKYIEVENLDGENQYDAGSEHGKQDAKKGVIFTKFPPVLTIHLKRFDFDFESMGFKKIHDNFEFPTVLDVGKYLAEDAEEEISSGSHRYLLHSVLVHAGDVGGGHYYAYIRPGTDQNYQEVYAKTVDDAVINSPSFTFYDKSPQASQAKTRSTSGEGQFYKFNDELVSAASSKEAVEACYGRRVSPYFKDVIHTMNSAYMLVYIRQEEAKDIMTPITSEDIPTSLLQRLVEEQRKRKQIQAKATHQKRYCNIYYATEKHVANFVDYSKSQYFISTPHMQSMQMMVDSTRLGVLLRIASELDISPVLLKLWRIGNRVRDASVNDPLIIQEDLSTKELSATIDESHFFVQKVSLVGDGSQNNYQELQDTFTKEYMLLKEKESEWLQVVRDALKEHTEWYEIGLPLDPCYGCGIGMSNKILEELRSHDEDLYDNLVKEMTSLTLHMMNILLEFGIEHLRLYGQPKSAQETSTLQRTEDDEDKAETALVFFKVFDPYNMLPTTFNNSLQTTPSSAASKTRMDIDEQVSSTAQDSGSNSLGVYNIVNHFTADDAGITAFNQTIQQLATSPSSDSQHPQEMTGNESIDFFTEKKAVQQYMPLKYFGYVALNPDDNVKKLYSVALKLINRSNKYTNYTYPEVWLKSEHIQLHYYQTALRVMPATVFASDDSENTLFSLLSEKDRHDKDKDNDYPLSVVLIISIKPHYYTHSTMTIPRHIPYLEQPELWCKYFVNQRRFYIQPLGPAELRALYNQYLIDQAERHKQQFNDNGLPLIRKRVLEASDGDNKDSSTSPVPSVRIKSGLEMTISVLHTMQETVEMIANELQVNPQHLVLFLVPMYVDPITQQVSNNAVDPYEFAKDVALPITMYGSLTEDVRFPRTGREPLSAFFARHKYNQPRCYNTFLLLYQLVPYPIQLPPNLSADEDEEDVEGKDEEGAQEMKGSGDSKENAQNKKSDRIIEIILGDEYLRQRRKRYLEHVFSEQLRLYQPRDVLFQDINADLITQQSSSAKRRKTLTWEQGHSNHAATSTSTDYFQEDEPCLVDVKFPLNPYHILEAHRMLIKISADMTVHDLLRHIRNMLNIPVEYSTDDQDETEKQCLHMIKRKIPTLVSEHIQASHDTSKDHFPNIYLALHSIHQGMLVTTLTHDRSLYEFPANWCEPLYGNKNPNRVVLQSTPRMTLPYIVQQHSSCRSIAVSVFNFTLLGNLVKCCEPTAFFPPFVTYVREDDTYNSLLNRLIEISGDSSLAFCRLSVVERSFVPTFIPRTSGNGSVHRSLSTTLSSAESIQSLESCSTPIVASNTTTTFSDHEDGDEEDTENEMTSPLPSNVKISTPNTGGVNPAGPTVWSYFAEKYPQHAQHDIFTAFEMNRRINPRNTSSVFAHAWLGVQRATADLQLATQLKRSKRSHASIGIKINK